MTPSRRLATSTAVLLVLFPAVSPAGTTILHYRVNDTDAATVGAGTVPGTDGSPAGTVAFGMVSLSSDLPTENLPAGGGNRSLVCNGAAGINLPGTQQLLNSVIASNGGFTYEAWFKYAGGGTINSIIDYAGTEKLVREFAMTTAGYRNNSAAPLYDLGNAPAGEWHYAAIVFAPTGPVGGDGSITGDFTFYYDGVEPVSTQVGVTISNFGDSLNRTICVGAHPLGFAADFFNGLLYEPRVSLGALSPDALLFPSGPTSIFQIISLVYDPAMPEPNVFIEWNSQPGGVYAVDYATELASWQEITDSVDSGGETSTFSHFFLPGDPGLIGMPQLYYRVRQVFP